MALPTIPRPLPPDVIKRALDYAERDRPDLWRIAYPRIFTEPTCGQYYSPKYLACQLVGVTEKLERGMEGRSEQFEFMVVSHLARFAVPQYWLSTDIAQAIRQTAPPGDIEWYDMPLPFEAAAFHLPKGTLTHSVDGDVPFVAYARIKAGIEYRSPLLGRRTYGSTDGGMIFMALTVRGGYLMHWNLPLEAFGRKIQLPDIDQLVQRYTSGDDKHRSGVWFLEQPDMSPEDNSLMAEAAHYVFGTLLLMDARPDLVTHGSMQKRVPGKRGVAPREFWHPNVVGEFYRIRREGESLGGTHASPRFHWVKGHYKHVAYGEGRSLRSRRWIEPFTRG